MMFRKSDYYISRLNAALVKFGYYAKITRKFFRLVDVGENGAKCQKIHENVVRQFVCENSCGGRKRQKMRQRDDNVHARPGSDVADTRRQALIIPKRNARLSSICLSPFSSFLSHCPPCFASFTCSPREQASHAANQAVNRNLFAFT